MISELVGRHFVEGSYRYATLYCVFNAQKIYTTPVYAYTRAAKNDSLLLYYRVNKAKENHGLFGDYHNLFRHLIQKKIVRLHNYD